ncbi:ArsR/SmtB family transcription factor [Sulfitobacter sp. JB4-11]|uniref:ArsR/SmtB family transcription factor n=1 Tax=Sulfitobacter rhodophyticola TaxID=3238304 RepID=UPI003518ED99
MADPSEPTAAALRALSNPNRLTILRWLRDPTAHFPPQRDGDLVEDGVCVGFITKKIGLSQPAVSEHMQVLAEAGFVNSKKIRNWVFYKLDQKKVSTFLDDLKGSLVAPHAD